MTRLATIGFEAGHARSEGLTQLAGTITYDASNGRPRTGATANSGTCLSVTPNGTQQGVNLTGSTLANATDYYIRTYFWKSANPSASTIAISSFDGTVNPIQVRCTTAGALLVQDSLNATLFTSSALNSSQWYRVELHVKTATSTTGVAELWLDDALLYSASNLNLGTGATWTPYWGNIGSATSAGSEFRFDDIAINNTSGSDENGRPGDGKVYLLRPASDPGTSSSSWTKPGGGTTNRHTSVDNVPPVLETFDDTSASAEDYLRQKATGANTDLFLTLTDYVTAGAIGKIKLIQPVILTGSDSGTDTAGEIGLSSNPTIANVAFTTFDSGIASATVTTWLRTTGTLTYSPAGIAPATGPVITVRKVTSTNARAAIVNFAGLIVEDTEFIPDVNMADRIT